VIWLNQQKKERKRVLIASNTKNLQEQIFYKEIPFVNEKLKLPFKAVLLKGRSNYICLTRWHRYLNALPQQLHVASRSAIIPIIIWLKHTHTGDISENNGFKLAMHRYIWNEICSEPGYCTTSVCQKYGGCFLGKARYDAFSSDVMIVNHSLLLADSAADNQILPEFNALIIDEAHNLEKNSYNYFAQRVNLPMLTYFLNGLYNGSIPERGLLVDITEIARQLKSLNKIEQHRLKIIEKIGDIKIAAEIFFRKIVSSKINKVSNSSKMFGIKRRYKDFSAEFPGFEIETSSLIYELSTCAALLTDLYNLMEEVCADYSDEYDEMRLRLINQKMMLEVYLETLRTVTTANNEALIFWYEIAANGKDNYVEIVCTPLNIATDIFEKVYGKVSSTVLTSATLQVAESFDYILTRSGLNLIEEHPVISRALGSPFFYNDQMAFYTYHQNEREVNEAFTTARLIKRLAGETGKGILVLFTSYSFLYEVYQLCLPAFMEMGITLLAQGQGASRTAILEQFRIEQNSVLFGTDSFWEGVDVIGSALEILVITKLPFPVPSEPIIEANVERLKNEDRDPFNEYYVPESVLKFRQGVGRLIRSINDVGVVINLDSRIDKKAYGRYFKKSLPVEPVSIMGEDELLAVVRKFFRIGK
jgi:Rad3-related DNA helicase